jgi:hypothetical protein
MKKVFHGIFPVLVTTAFLCTVILACTIGDLSLRKAVEGLNVAYEWFPAPPLTEKAAASTGNWFGDKVAISGTTLVVSTLNANRVTLYEGSGASWTALPALALAYPPSCVALTDAFLAIGNSDNDKVAVYHKVKGTWNPAPQELSGALFSGFGYSVAISGSRLVVGAPYESNGYAYTYVYSGGTWSLKNRIQSSDSAAGDLFGTSVALCKDYAFVGACNKDSDKGSVYIFLYDGSQWGRTINYYENRILTLSDGSNGNKFGNSISMDGDLAVVGAPGRNSSYLYTNAGASNWSLEKVLSPKGGKLIDAFGWSVSISVTPDRTFAIGGAKNSDSGRGSAYIFDSGTDWDQFPTLADDGATGDEFGCAVGISGDTAIVGAHKHLVDGKAAAGAAYVFIRQKQ